jgi:cathepsin L
MKAAVIVCVVVALFAFAASESVPSFAEYVLEHGKSYTPAEYALHQAIFDRNVADILAHNADSSQAYKKGINLFTDMTAEEFAQYKGNSVISAVGRKEKFPAASFPTVPVSELPDSVDWRGKGVLTPVKNQGSCGSCWAFAATEGIEATVAKDTGKLLVLSAQDITSCTKNPQHCGGTGGCGGATSELAYEQVQQAGIALESAYPYTAQTGSCKTTIAKSAKIKGYVKLAENNYTELINAVATVGPIAVSVDATVWSSYRSGIFTGCPGAGRNVIIDHAVQLVGYGTEAGRDYWIVRNSWGAAWGEAGYIRILRHSDGDKSKWCNIDNRPADGTGCDGGPAQVTVCGSCGIWYDSAYAVGGSTL